MVWLATALALTLPQDLQKPPVTAEAAPQRDQIVLEGGETIVGQILKQAGNYIEVRIDANTVVGFERSRIESIVRGGKLTAPAIPGKLMARDNWFLLHGGDGRALGYLHGLVQVQEDGAIHLTEEWLFTGNKGSTRITLLEIVDAQLKPRSCFYHERVADESGRLQAESLRHGRVQGNRLLVDSRSLRGHEKQEYRLDDQVCFPLAFREEIRQHKEVAIHAANQTVFDTKTGQFRVIAASSVQRRKVEFGERVVTVREVSIRDGQQTNAEWIDANCQVLRREVNGAALVAIKVDRARALRAETTHTLKVAHNAVATSSDGRLGLWLPNPIWRTQHAARGSITIEAPLFGASATLLDLDQLSRDLHLSSAADAVLRWLRLSVDQKLSVVERSELQVRGLPATKLDIRWQTRRIGEAMAFRGSCYVFRSQGRYLAFFCAVPRHNFAALQSDIGRLLDSVQLMAEDIVPRLQGPLARFGR